MCLQNLHYLAPFAKIGVIWKVHVMCCEPFWNHIKYDLENFRCILTIDYKLVFRTLLKLKETTPSTFPSKFSSEIYLSRIINSWGGIFTLYLTWGAFSWLAFYLYFFFFLSIFFYRYFPWQTQTITMIAGNGEGIIIFLVFYFHPLTNIHLVHRDFYHFFLIDLFVITRLIPDATCSP